MITSALVFASGIALGGGVLSLVIRIKAGRWMG